MQIANISTECVRDITACELFNVDERLLSLGNISSQCGPDINVGLKYMVQLLIIMEFARKIANAWRASVPTFSSFTASNSLDR